MQRGRGTLQPVVGRKPTTRFLPARTPIDAIAPQSATVSMADSDITSTHRIHRSTDLSVDVPILEDSSESTTSSSTSSEPVKQTLPQHEQIYLLQDENADLKKCIHSLEIVLRDHGFAKDGRQIINRDEIVRVRNDCDEDGFQRSHMEMVSMMGMDPEKPTVLTKYLEFKVTELEDELDKKESDRLRLTTLVRNLTSELSSKDSVRQDKIREQKHQKRKLEDKLTTMMAVSKTRESLLTQKVAGLESSLADADLQKKSLLQRIAELEATVTQHEGDRVRDQLLSQKVESLESKLALHSKQELLLKEQITALETNLEWNIEESTKREKLLQTQITALETNLEWNIEQSTKREGLLREQEEIIEKTTRSVPSEDDDDSDSDSDDSDSDSDDSDDGDDSDEEEDGDSHSDYHFERVKRKANKNDGSLSRHQTGGSQHHRRRHHSPHQPTRRSRSWDASECIQMQRQQQSRWTSDNSIDGSTRSLNIEVQRGYGGNSGSGGGGNYENPNKPVRRRPKMFNNYDNRSSRSLNFDLEGDDYGYRNKDKPLRRRSKTGVGRHPSFDSHFSFESEDHHLYPNEQRRRRSLGSSDLADASKPFRAGFDISTRSLNFQLEGDDYGYSKPLRRGSNNGEQRRRRRSLDSSRDNNLDNSFYENAAKPVRRRMKGDSNHRRTSVDNDHSGRMNRRLSDSSLVLKKQSLAEATEDMVTMVQAATVEAEVQRRNSLDGSSKHRGQQPSEKRRNSLESVSSNNSMLRSKKSGVYNSYRTSPSKASTSAESDSHEEFAASEDESMSLPQTPPGRYWTSLNTTGKSSHAHNNNISTGSNNHNNSNNMYNDDENAKLDELNSSLSQIFEAFNNSISEISRQHNKQLAEWNVEELELQKEQLREQISALETNLEWNMKESKKQEGILRDQVTALETNLEWNIEEFTKREALLQERITELEAKKNVNNNDDDNFTLGSISNPSAYVEQQSELKRIKHQKAKLEEWLSKVVEESTKREKNLQRMISDLESTAGASSYREELLKAQVNELETNVERLQTDQAKFGDLESVLKSALEKEVKKQERLAKTVAELKGTVEATEEVHEAQKDRLTAQIHDLETKLESTKAELKAELLAKQKKKKERDIPSPASSDVEEDWEAVETEVPPLPVIEAGDSSSVVARKEKENLSNRISELESELESERKRSEVESKDFSNQISELESQLETERKRLEEENECLNSQISELESKLESERKHLEKENEGLNSQISELESKLESEQKRSEEENECLNSQISELESKLESGQKLLEEENEGLSSRISEIETELESERKRLGEEKRDLASQICEYEEELEAERQEKLERYELIADLQTDLQEASDQNDSLEERILELETELESERDNELDRSQRVAKLRENIKDIAEKNEILTERVSELEDELESERMAHLDGNKRFTNLKKDIVKLTQENEGLTNSMLEIEDELEYERKDKFDRNKRIAELQSDLEDAASKHGPLAARIEELENEVEAGKQECRNFEERMADLKTELNARDQKCERTKAERDQLETELKTARTEHVRLNKCVDVLTNRLKESNLNPKSSDSRGESLEAELESVKTGHDKLNLCIKELQSKVEPLHNSSDHSRTINPPRHTKVIPEIENEPEPEKTFPAPRNTVIAELKAELENRKMKEEIIDLKDEMQTAAWKYERQEEEFKTRIQALETELEFGQHEHERLERVIFVLRNELKMAAENHEPVINRNRELEKDLLMCKEEEERLAKEVADLKSELETKNKDFNNDVLDLKMKLKSKLSENEHLNEFKHELEAELEETTKKVRKIEREFETAARTMDTTFEEISVRNTQLERELGSYKSENQYLNKFIAELQNELAEKHDAAIAAIEAPSVRSHELKTKMHRELSDRAARQYDGNTDDLEDALEMSDKTEDDIKAASSATSDRTEDDLLVSETIRSVQAEDDLMVSDTTASRISGDDLLISESNGGTARSRQLADDLTVSDHDIKDRSNDKSKDADDDEPKETSLHEIKDSERSRLIGDDLILSESTKGSQRAALDDDIDRVEKELGEEKSRQESLNKIITDLREEKAEVKDAKSPKAKSLTSQIRESEAELEALNAHIYELEGDLEELLDEVWDLDRSRDVESMDDQEEDLGTPTKDGPGEPINTESPPLDPLTVSSREHLTNRIVELKKDIEELEEELEELEDELEDTIERSKKEKDRLTSEKANIQKRLEATVEKAKREHQSLAFKNAELEKKLKETIEKGRKEQQTLAIHYIELEKESKSMATKARREEQELRSQIAKLEKEVESNRGMVENEDDSLVVHIADLIDEINSIKKSQKSAPSHDLGMPADSDAKMESSSKKSEKQENIADETQSDLVEESPKPDKANLASKISELKQEFHSTFTENQTLNDKILLIETKLSTAQETIQLAEKEAQELNTKYTQLEARMKESDDDHDTAIWEAEQKQRDLIEMANVERKEKKRLKEECSTLKEDFKALQEVNGKLSSQIKNSGGTRREDDNEDESLVLRVAELEEEIRSVSKQKDTQISDYKHEIDDLRKGLHDSKRENETLSSQIESHELEMKEHSRISDRCAALEKEFEAAIEKNKVEEKLHLELKQRLVDITMKNQADKANLDNRMHKLQKELQSTSKELEATREKNESLSRELKFFEAEKNRLNCSDLDIEDELRSTFDENEVIFRKIQAYENDTITSPNVSRNKKKPTTPLTESEKTNLFDEGTESSERDLSHSEISEGDIDIDSGHTNLSAERKMIAGSGSVSSQIDEPEEDIPDELQSQNIEEYLAPLVDRADKVLGQDIPNTVIQGIHDVMKAEKSLSESFVWEDFESILEEVCQDYDQDTWFDIQEAFFVAWEETEIQKMGGDLDLDDDDDDDDDESSDDDQ